MSKTNQKNKFPVVAIGASAGGLEAIIEILRNLSPDTGMAFIYIQHLDPNRKSLLTSILGNVTRMKVTEATHKMKVLPDHIYIIPHNQDMSITENQIILNKRHTKGGLHMPIDQFFVSLAERQKEDAIAILLSGTAHDGTIGLKSIKLAGGITIAQDDTAKFPGMPKSAVDEGVVDLILPPIGIARELERLGKQTEIVKKALESNSEMGAENKEIYLTTIIQLLKKATGVDFTHYKMNTIRRRIIRRMLLHNLKTLHEYAGYLRRNNDELDSLYRDLLINVTSFFRDVETYEFLKKTLFPKILKSKGNYEPIRIWIPACSTGEEAYSIAILLLEILGDKATDTPLQIFATDLSEKVIAKARRGVYTRNDLLNVSADRVQRFFTKAEGEYRIIKGIRDICVFAPQNVFRDPPFSKVDFISCCNLMIYLDTMLQKKILATFHYALNNNGYLMLGKSETIGNSIQLFTQMEKKYRIYMKRKDVSSAAMFDLTYNTPQITVPESPKPRKIVSKIMQLPPSDLEKTVNEILLKKYIPATVVVNAELEILHFKGSTGLFLEPSPGKASLNLLKMVRPGLEFELRNTIHKASKSGQAEKKKGLEININGTIHYVSVEVSPLKSENEERLFLIVLEEMLVLTPLSVRTSTSKDKVVEELQEELKGTREDMRSMLEEQETNHEELQSANEEVLSSNEELQSINEELETSKEEIESANEELITINTELQTRNEQLSEAYGYSEAIIGIIREAVLVLDKSYKVKTANNSFYQIFKATKEKTEGKLMYDLNNGHWNIPELKKLLENTARQNNQVSGYEVECNFPGIGRKVLLFNARKLAQKSEQQYLLLLAIEDITEHREAEKIIASREAWFRNMADNAPVLIWVTDKDNRETFFNKTWREYTGRLTGSSNILKQDIHPDDVKKFQEIFRISSKQQKAFSHEFRMRRFDGEYRWILIAGKPTYSAERVFTGLIGTGTEIHDQRLTKYDLENKIVIRTQELATRNSKLEISNRELQQFAYVASHDLQEPLRKIISFTDKLKNQKEDFSGSTKNYIDRIGSASVRMTQLIDDLLNFSRISNTTEKFVRTDLNEIIRNLLPDFEHVIQEKKARIKAGTLPVLDAISIQMTQLFHNLISNALKFSKDKIPPVVKIGSRALNSRSIPAEFKNNKSAYVEITCSDNGIGFSKKYAEQVFTIFQRLNDREDYPGTGIGLALCRKIVNNHGGKILAESIKNKGTTFRIILPVKQTS